MESQETQQNCAQHFAVCVFCGARDGAEPPICTEAEALGRGLATMDARLVYGAGDLGLMGRVSAAARAAGGQTTGVIPRGLWEREVKRRPLPADILVESLHHRKSVMLANAHAVVALPGGTGTLDELVEALTWAQLGLHKKPIYLLNIDGYWEPLLRLLEHMANQGFLHSPVGSLLQSLPDAAAVLEALAAFRASDPRL